MFCPNCGRQIPDSSLFCPDCGASTGSGSNSQQNTGQDQPYQNQQPYGQQSRQYQGEPVYSGTVIGDTTGIVPRNIALAIVLSIITCGIYGIYWFVVMTNEANQLSGRTNETSGGLAFLLTLITCGIYGWYWAYKMGEKTDIIKGGSASGSSSALFLVLQILGLGIVNYALAQDAINNAVS